MMQAQRKPQHNLNIIQYNKKVEEEPRRTFKETLLDLLNRPTKELLTPSGAKYFSRIYDLEKTALYNICLAMVFEALKGNTKALIFIRDTIGQKPTDKKQVEEINPEIINQVAQWVKGKYNKSNGD